MAEGQMMTPADVVAKAMDGQHGDPCRWLLGTFELEPQAHRGGVDSPPVSAWRSRSTAVRD